MNFLIVAAMHDEIDEFNKHATLIETEPFKLYQYNNHYIVISGIGKTNASAATSYALTKYPIIDHILNIGFAGGTRPYHVGDVVAVNEACYHDVDLTMFGYEKGQIPKSPAVFQSDLSIVSNLTNYAKLYTGDYFMLNLPSEVAVFDMEGADIFQVADKFNKKSTSIKVISDIIGNHNQLDNYTTFESTNGARIIKDILMKILEV